MGIFKKHLLTKKLNNIPFLLNQKGSLSYSSLGFKDLYQIFLNHIRFFNFVFINEIIEKEYSYKEVADILSGDFSLLNDDNNIRVHEFLVQTFSSSLFSKIEDRKYYYSIFSKVKTYAKPVFLSMDENHLKIITNDFLNVFNLYISFLYETLKIKLFYYEKDQKLWDSFLPLVDKEHPHIYSLSTGLFVDLFPFVIFRDGEFLVWQGALSPFTYKNEKGEILEVKTEEIREKILEYCEYFFLTEKAKTILSDSDNQYIRRAFRNLEKIKRDESKGDYLSLIKDVSNYKFSYRAQERENKYLEYLIAKAYKKLGNFSQAIVLMEKVMEMSPDFHYPYLLLIEIYIKNNQPTKANFLIERLKKHVFQPEILKRVSKLQEALLKRKGTSSKLKLDKELIDLKKRMEEMSPVIIGREDKTMEALEALSCMRKNSLIILGDPGVGKTSIVYNVVHKIVKEEVPENLKDIPVYELNIGALFSGTKYRGQLEEKLLAMFNRLEEEQALLFVDDMNFLIGNDATKGASFDFSSFLKPYLERKKLKIIATSNYEDYIKTVSRIPVYTRLFQRLDLKELDRDDVSIILKIKADELSRYHNVTIDIERIVEHIELVKQFFRERMLPDKAIELLDRTCSRVNYEYFRGEREDNIVGELDFLKTIAQTKGVELSTISMSLKERLKNLSSNLKKSIIGQDRVIDELVKKIIPAKMGFKLNPDRPDGVFLFIGPTGVGKTELARKLAKELYGDEKKLLRFDMSEYMEEFTFSRLIGAAPGYVGYYDQNQLTDEMKKDPYRVILLDEIEKAHPQLINIFLQVFDSGVLTDARGNKAYFDNSIIIMTSNVGTSLFSKINVGFDDNGIKKGKVTKSELSAEIKRFFKPEFLNRVDEILYFNSLTKEDAKKIVAIKIDEFNKKMKNKLSVEADDLIIEHLAERGFSQEFGAREILRVLQNELLLKIANKQLLSEGNFRKVFVSFDKKTEEIIIREEILETDNIKVGKEEETEN